jgi:hypothetical protein
MPATHLQLCKWDLMLPVELHALKQQQEHGEQLTVAVIHRQPEVKQSRRSIRRHPPLEVQEPIQQLNAQQPHHSQRRLHLMRVAHLQ